MWANVPGQPVPVRVDLRGKPGPALAGQFSTEVGIGQYGITVLDHANGMATFAADGKRADAHFVRSVSKNGDQVYEEKLTRPPIGLSQDQINELDATLNQVPAGHFSNDWDTAGQDRHLAVRHEHHPELARLDGRLHPGDGGRGLGRHQGRRPAGHQVGIVRCVRCRLRRRRSGGSS